MIDALVTGRLAADPKPGTAKNGSAFATARLLVTTNDEQRLSVSVIAFEAVDALLALSGGDTVTLAGELIPKAWTDSEGNARPAADLKAHAVLTPYHVRRKRLAVQDAGECPR